jgi:hypothetical protein
MPLQSTSGAASYDAFGGGAAVIPNYIEEVFSTYLYTGNGSTQTITNGIDLAGEGGLVWTKSRSNAENNVLTNAQTFARQSSNTTDATVTGAVIAVSATGFTAASAGNTNAYTYASWTFRKQPKFFDVVTYTGDGTNTNRRISHNLGSAPGCIIVKRTDSTSDWVVYHRSLPADATNRFLMLNSTDAYDSSGDIWGSAAPTATDFGVGNSSIKQNLTGATYVCYLFAHDAGGFGLTGTDNVISCGSVTSTSGGTIPTVNLGFEPQWILYKNTTSAWNWEIWDNMRGWSIASNGNATANALKTNTSDAETSGNTAFTPTATGFFSNANFGNTQTFIYIAIRRGAMKVPTSGASVYNGIIRTGTGEDATVINSGFTPDVVVPSDRAGSSPTAFTDRLRGQGVTGAMNLLRTSQTSAESYDSGISGLDVMNGFKAGAGNYGNGVDTNYVNWLFKRAPGFFDVVCYTGTGVARTVAHNLAAVPEFMVVKRRNTTGGWVVYSATSGATKYQYLNNTIVATTFASTWNNTAPTSSVFTVGTDPETNGSGSTFVAYLFGTVAGVSKVGSYTGTGSGQNIDCGFTGGARFVMIKRTDQVSDWYVWDTARGIVSASDPYLRLNAVAAEVTNTDWIDPLSSGFSISLAASVLVASGGTYIFLAIA